MADLLQLRDALALNGQANVRQLSASLNQPTAMTEAMLEQLVLMGKAERVEEPNTVDLTGHCRHCPEGANCAIPYYRLRVNPVVAGH
ncbi:FeoC-like transcriptional regulator [Acerihabitans sp. TG2]|uniref:FeoC-like transcriptional regulator n=1 Tax=Acerihabitans sp. TG2 TaxID=3096008 RepID=UPI002B22684F|nr:FeoC-like transcriptional regulator [Acerihabitans sp. TG2]MEA9390911.1 FeoC-like transcriptional regulator [Acerihabitans sp. TG2]